jgi:hypothetical protein
VAQLLYSGGGGLLDNPADSDSISDVPESFTQIIGEEQPRGLLPIFFTTCPYDLGETNLSQSHKGTIGDGCRKIKRIDSAGTRKPPRGFVSLSEKHFPEISFQQVSTAARPPLKPKDSAEKSSPRKNTKKECKLGFCVP